MTEPESYTITKEQLDAITSDYMTKDTLQLLAKEIRNNKSHKVVAEETLRRLEWYRGVANKIRPHALNHCVLYELGGRGNYCSTRCPFCGPGRCGCDIALMFVGAGRDIKTLEEVLR